MARGDAGPQMHDDAAQLVPVRRLFHPVDFTATLAEAPDFQRRGHVGVHFLHARHGRGEPLQMEYHDIWQFFV